MYINDNIVINETCKLSLEISHFTELFMLKFIGRVFADPDCTVPLILLHVITELSVRFFKHLPFSKELGLGFQM